MVHSRKTTKNSENKRYLGQKDPKKPEKQAKSGDFGLKKGKKRTFSAQHQLLKSTKGTPLLNFQILLGLEQFQKRAKSAKFSLVNVKFGRNIFNTAICGNMRANRQIQGKYARITEIIAR